MSALFPAGRNRLIEGDCLAVMRRLPAATVDLIYVDPPFFSGRDRALSPPRSAEAPPAATDDPHGPASTGGPAPAGPGAAFADRWPGGLADYLGWLVPRLREMHRLLGPTGSLFVHLDWHAVHYVKCALDEIFGYERFRNQIVWHYGSGGRARTFFPRKHDLILWYTKSQRWTFNAEAIGVPRRLCPACGAVRARWNHLRRHIAADGRVYRTIRSAGRLYRYYDDELALPPDVWLDLSHLQQRDSERLGYPTQKPEALLTRIVSACSLPGQIVADFCCGSGTTLVVAERLGRRWIGCDVSPVAVSIAAQRLARLHAPAAARSPRHGKAVTPHSRPASQAPRHTIERCPDPA